MKKINRREFIGRTTMSLGAAFALSQLPKQLLANAAFSNIPIGFQTWSVKDMLAKDFAGTLKMMAGLGYQLIEMCSPKGYATIGFGAFVNMKTTDIRKTI